MLPIPYTLEGLRALPPEERAALAARLLPSYPPDLEEDQILQHPLTYLLTLLYESELPREVPPTPSEIFSMVGYAATNQKILTTTPPQYVWGEVRNREKKLSTPIAKGKRYQRHHQKTDIAPEGRESARQLWQRLPPEMRTTFLLVLRYSVAELATLWGLTREGAKTRIRREREVLQNIIKKFENT